MLILSLSRYTDKYSFPVAILYGAAKKNYRAFLKIVVDEFEACTKRPIEVKKNGRLIATSFISLLAVIGDGLEQSAMMSFAGHFHRYGCRYCLTRGDHPNDKGAGNNGGMYFYLHNQPLREKESLTMDDPVSSILFSMNMDLYLFFILTFICFFLFFHTKKDNEFGLKDLSVFAPLDTAAFLGFYSIDEMHLFSNFSKLFFSLLSSNHNDRYKNNGKKVDTENDADNNDDDDTDNDDDDETSASENTKRCRDKYPFEISPADLEMIKNSIDASTRDIPTMFSSSWKGLNYHNSRAIFRSVDWIEHFIFSVPTLISPKFKHAETTKAVNALARACLIAIQWVISPDELAEMTE
jgi:hypothetical protein